MLVLVALTERFVDRHYLDFTNAAADNWSYSACQARRKTDPGMILCFGTSLAKYGVVAPLIERATGHRTFNLAVCRGQMPSTYFLFRRAIDAGARPAAVLLDCQDGPPACATPEPRAEAIDANLRQWPELLTWGDCLDLAWTARDARFVAEMAIAGLIPSSKARFEIRSSVLTALRGEPAVSRRDTLALRRNWTLNKGTMLMPRRQATPADDHDPLPEDIPATTKQPPARPPRNRLSDAYIRRLLELAAAHKIPVFWLLPPVAPAKQAERDREGYTAYFTEQALRAEAAYHGVTVLDARRSRYRTALFHDAVHLDRRGALPGPPTWGRRLPAPWKVRLQAARWVNLPPFRDRPVEIALEDVIESRLAGPLGSRRVRR